jgi:hypothetical protein
LLDRCSRMARNTIMTKNIAIEPLIPCPNEWNHIDEGLFSVGGVCYDIVYLSCQMLHQEHFCELGIPNPAENSLLLCYAY